MNARYVGCVSLTVSAWLAVTANVSMGASRDVMSTLVTAAGRADLQQVIQIGRADLSSMILEQLASKAAAIRETKESLKSQGLEVGMSYEIKLGPNVSVSVAVEDLPALSAWDGKSKPTFPFDFKVKQENEATGKEASVEIRYNPASKETAGIESIQFEGKQKVGATSDRVTVKISGTPDKPVVEVDYGKGVTTSEKLKEATGFEFEGEQSIGLNSSGGTDTLYTEDMEKSDWWIVRTVEDFVAKLTWGVSGSVSHEKKLEGGDKLNSKVKYTFGTEKVRNWWTDWLFSDADEAAQKLDEQLTRMGEWRRNRIEIEAHKRGIDPTGKTNAQLIQEVSDARRKAGVTDPVFKTRQSGNTTGGGTDATTTGGGQLPPPIQGSTGSGRKSGGGGNLNPY
jgi:hypothetical protein